MRRRSPRQVSRVRHIPVLRLLLYYAALVTIAIALAHFVPITKEAFVAPVSVPAIDQAGGLLNGQELPPTSPAFSRPFGRSVITIVVILGALGLSMPIAFVSMWTRRYRFDPSLIQSIIILPIVVAGIVLLVKESLALAFSLTGIVGVVRFRNTLKDPKDAVYIFLVLGVGLAAGVQALDVALLVSLAFNMIVLCMWKWDVGGFYATAGEGGLLTIGDAELLPFGGEREPDRLRHRANDLASDMETDGYLLVYAADPAAARRCVEISLTEFASNWRVGDARDESGGLSSFVVAIDLRGKASPVDLLGDLDERWPEQLAAAEYLPYRHEGEEEEEDDE
jgi:hypothetical protein